MTITLTEEKATNLKHACQGLLNRKSSTVREVVWVIDKLVSSFPGTCMALSTIGNLIGIKPLH